MKVTALGVACIMKVSEVAMRRKRFDGAQCPIARALERVGEWWSILILREAMLGVTRFDDFQKSLGIAPNILTVRLNKLVESGLLERRAYSERPTRCEYRLTPTGEDFRPVLWSLLAWGSRHFAPEGQSLVIVDVDSGAWADPILVDRASGKRMAPPEFRTAAGPAASAAMRARHRLASAYSGAPLELAGAPHETSGDRP